MRRTLVALTLAALPLTTGCYKFVIDTPAPHEARRQSATGASFIGGATAVEREAPACRNGIAKIAVSRSFAGVLLNFITLGLATGMEAEYQCVDSRGAAIRSE